LTTVANATHNATFLNVGYLSRILPSVIAMSILFVLSAVGNVTVFSTLVGSRRRRYKTFLSSGGGGGGWIRILEQGILKGEVSQYR
jgi:hypothetical protein